MNFDPIWWRSLAKALLLPPTGLLLLALAGLLMSGARPRLGRALALAGVVILLVLSLAPVSSALQRSLGGDTAFDPRTASDARAIVILGGGLRRDAPEYGGYTVGTLTLERVRYGARVAKMTGLPVLVTGGTVLRGPPESHVMKRVLEEEFDVRVRWVEDRSRNTRGNAQNSAEILKAQGIHRVVLVAHAFDMRRAIAEFRAAGIEVVPAPTGLSKAKPSSLLDWIPGHAALVESSWALYEWIGNAVRLLGM